MVSDNNSPLLRVEDLSVSFRIGAGKTEVTHNVSFDIERGETVALVGESGSGKSVTAMAIVDLLPGNAVRAGKILFDGKDLITANAAQMREIRGQKIAVVFQEPMTALNPVMTIGALLAQAITSHGTLARDDVRARSLELLRLVEMPEPERRIRQYAHQLSGGQRQRAMIAMAIAGDPDVIIADEPTTALDVTAQASILDLLQSIQKRLSTAVLMITHDMGVVADVADRVIVMKDGRLVEDASAVNLFQAPQHDYTRRLLAAVPHLGRSPGVMATPTTPLEVLARASSNPLVPDAVLDVKDLVVEYPGRMGQSTFRAVNEVSFQVGEGEVVGLVGESGSGKSTIGRVAVGLVRASGGQMLVNGIDVARPPRHERRELRKRAAIIFQDPASSLNPRATVGESISLPLRWNKLERRGSELRKIVLELLDSVHLPKDAADRFPHELSGGQRQRVGIARAMAMKPELLIADEPTSALDVSVQAAVLELLVELQQRRRFSCLFISHDLSVVEQLAQRVVVLQNGRVAEQGDTRQILHHPRNEYTQRLVSAIPVPDPVEQHARRAARLAGSAV